MNKIYILSIKALRYIYEKFKRSQMLPCYLNQSETNKIIRDLLDSDKPCMIARYGTVELNAVVNYISIINPHHSALKFVKGEQYQWWWNQLGYDQLQTNAGFFPLSENNVNRFCQLMVEDSRYVDLLGSMSYNETYMLPYLGNYTRVRLRYLEPDFFSYSSEDSWTKALAGKKVLVLHPFTETIKNQYIKKSKLFRAPDLLPDFELKTLKAVQSIGGVCEFDTWFDALHFMEDEISKIDFDICLLGCGAYGFPLAAYIKRMGKKAFHMGGSLQLLFGIRGKRWEDREDYKQIINEYWVRPDATDRPANAEKVEGACYW